MKVCYWFKDLGKENLSIAGGKGANLGELIKIGMPVPDGFVVSSHAYFQFIEKSSLKQKIKNELSNLNVKDTAKLQKASDNIQKAIYSADIPKQIKTQIIEHYQEMSGVHDKKVAVRSSATAEDLPTASFAGQQETFLNVEGSQEVVAAVKGCWASLFEARAIFYREENGFDHLKIGIAVPVQLMVQSEVSGIMFTINPLTNNKEELSIEAAFGLGQPVVSGELTPDQYLVSKHNNEILEKVIIKQTWQFTNAGNLPISPAYQKRQKLEDKHIRKLAEYGQKIEQHYGIPQDIEWGLYKKRLYILQSRPVTTLKISEDKVVLRDEDLDENLILDGLGASPGIGTGKVHIIKSKKEIKDLKQGEVLVTEMTNPDFVPAMKKSAAIVTDKGGRTSHAAIVSRELGIPCVVGTGSATKMLSNGEVITVDGANGKIYQGNLSVKKQVSVTGGEKIKTATKMYVNMGEPDRAEELAKLNVDGVGLLRAEFMISTIGEHPRKFIEEKREKEFINKLVKGLETFCSAFKDRPVVYRTNDFKTNEHINLKGGKKYEIEEPNPMIGYRGAGRYIAEPEVLRMEIEAIKDVRNKKGLKNLWVMIPFLRTPKELEEVKKIMAAEGLRRSPSFKLWMMVETPANVLQLEDYIKTGIDGVSVGSNDLTMLTLGVDRDNEKVSGSYDESDPAVVDLIINTIKTAKKHKITSSLCGQMASDYPNLVEEFVKIGITSVSVSPDVLEKTREIVFNAEKSLTQK